MSGTITLFEKIRAANMENGYSCEPEDFVFMREGERLKTYFIDKHYGHYCKLLGIAKKGNHKTRKTALTKIADNPNSNLKDAMQYGGHKDVKTFINHYCYSRYSDKHRQEELEKTLNV